MKNNKNTNENYFFLFYDYEFILNFLTNEEIGILIKTIFKYKGKKIAKPTENMKINKMYNFIIKRENGLEK